MRPALWFCAALAAAFVSHAAPAADVKAVLGACDNTPGCNYTINSKNGDITGCSTGSGTCFYCPNDGKRECMAVPARVQPGETPNYIGGADNLLTDIGAAPGKVQKPKLGAGSLAPAAPAAPAVSQ